MNSNLYLINLCGLPEGYEDTPNTPDVGEWQGLFNSNLELLDSWHTNDQSLNYCSVKSIFTALGFNLTRPSSNEESKMEMTLYNEAIDIMGV